MYLNFKAKFLALQIKAVYSINYVTHLTLDKYGQSKSVWDNRIHKIF